MSEVSCACGLTRRGLGEAFHFRYSTALEASGEYLIRALSSLVPSFLNSPGIRPVAHRGKLQHHTRKVFAPHLN